MSIDETSGERRSTIAPRRARARAAVPLALLAVVAVGLSQTDAMAHLAAVLWIVSVALLLLATGVAARSVPRVRR
ncbi:hypothetical protein ACGIF2_11450 [Cellulomonas sp. P22]|uniref:hypothetical protein n=1 Tax=Cellulomonas sp. P22 TaxID=3373189 RepID=UPI00378AD090